ncbi:thioredoxin family protein [Paenibacillus spongiae]|uniref:Thioredoxin n=1 Tax=Paenibacillus spongiae TaxID=2909671 RepID=A0ABY5SJY3_9BACL|nr:thioredoxin [Paenibacillus spongiae]UVI33012.1 thioredoxin [Paenibacillus spongiae]
MSLLRAESSDMLHELVREGVVLVDYDSMWCPPCKVLVPILEEIGRELTGKVRMVKVDCDELPESAAEAGVMGTPTVIVFKDGEPVDKLVGLRPKSQYIAVLERHIT